jgi:hypothetical protein
MSAGRWLLFLENMTSLEDYFTDIHIPLSCEFLVAQHLPGTKDVALTEVFYVHHTRPLQTHRAGAWSSSRGFTWATVTCDERRDLQGALLQSGIYSAVSFVLVTELYKVDNGVNYINIALKSTIKCLFRT